MTRIPSAPLALFAATLHCSVVWAAGQPLPGTNWQLVAIQSMDDAQGTTRVADPSRYTLAFAPDGRAALRLDCNRANGPYKAEPAADGSPSGSLSFGPVAGTRALCPPPSLDERVMRDLPYVRSYTLRDGKLYLSLMADGGIYEWKPLPGPAAPAPAASAAVSTGAADTDRSVRAVSFAQGATSAVIRGRIVGTRYVDYQLPAGAGQRLSVSLKGSHASTHFNLLPPESTDAAMARGELTRNRFNGLLPDDGVYTVRVFLQRAAARRNAASNFTLTLGLAGAALEPVAAKVDALVPGTRYHATASVPCEPAFTQARECQAFVVRRGFDGTATVELRWDTAGNRRILFVKGEPKAASVPEPMTFTRDAKGWQVTFNGDEHFHIPEPLVLGG